MVAWNCVKKQLMESEEMLQWECIKMRMNGTEKLNKSQHLIIYNEFMAWMNKKIIVKYWKMLEIMPACVYVYGHVCMLTCAYLS